MRWEQWHVALSVLVSHKFMCRCGEDASSELTYNDIDDNNDEIDGDDNDILYVN